MQDMIPLTGMQTVEFTPKAFRAEVDPEVKFIIRVPTFQMRDKMAALLFQRGFIPATLSQSRGILIDALYDLFDEATADDYATFLESYWTRSEVHEELIQGWQIQEAQRIFDLAMGAKGVPTATPIPPAPFTMREQARQARIVTEVLERSDRYRTYQARFMSAQEEEDEMLTRLFVAGWSGIDEAPAERDGQDRLTMDCMEAVRGWLRDAGADTAWDEVKAAVRANFGGSRGLEKNLDSPLGSNSSQTGSPDSSGDLAISDGSSTGSSTTPTPASRSRPRKGGSRNSPSGPRTKTKKNGPTAVPS